MSAPAEMRLAQSCMRCLSLSRAAAAAAAPAFATRARHARPYSTEDSAAEQGADRQARVDRLLSKARALKVQHLRNQAAAPSSASPSGSSSGVISGTSKLDQYAHALKRKAEQAGFDSVEALQRSLRAQAAQASVASLSSSPPPPPPSASSDKSIVGKTAFERKEDELKERLRARAAQREAERKADPATTTYDPSSPIKPLSAIMDLNKLLGIDTADGTGKADPQTVAELWTTYHTLKHKLSAVIPLATYERLLRTGQKYPRFVVPLARVPAAAAAAGASEQPAQDGGHEMFYLEWAALPPPTPHFALATTASSTAPLPSPSTVLFTSLAEYKLRQEFATPALVLTHYTDLAHSHGLVLMRGEISEPAAGGAAVLSDADAQQLCVTLQRFYLPAVELEGAASAERAELVRVFHEAPEEFDVQRLIKAASF